MTDLNRITYLDWDYDEHMYLGKPFLKLMRPSLNPRTGKLIPELKFNIPLLGIPQHELFNHAFVATIWAEVHETAEFFSVDGRPLHNPHTQEGHMALRDALRFVSDMGMPQSMGRF